MQQTFLSRGHLVDAAGVRIDRSSRSSVQAGSRRSRRLLRAAAEAAGPASPRVIVLDSDSDSDRGRPLTDMSTNVRHALGVLEAAQRSESPRPRDSLTPGPHSASPRPRESLSPRPHLRVGARIEVVFVEHRGNSVRMAWYPGVVRSLYTYGPNYPACNIEFDDGEIRTIDYGVDHWRTEDNPALGQRQLTESECVGLRRTSDVVQSPYRANRAAEASLAVRRAMFAPEAPRPNRASEASQARGTPSPSNVGPIIPDEARFQRYNRLRAKIWGGCAHPIPPKGWGDKPETDNWDSMEHFLWLKMQCQIYAYPLRVRLFSRDPRVIIMCIKLNHLDPVIPLRWGDIFHPHPDEYWTSGRSKAFAADKGYDECTTRAVRKVIEQHTWFPASAGEARSGRQPCTPGVQRFRRTMVPAARTRLQVQFDLVDDASGQRSQQWYPGTVIGQSTTHNNRTVIRFDDEAHTREVVLCTAQWKLVPGELFSQAQSHRPLTPVLSRH